MVEGQGGLGYGEKNMSFGIWQIISSCHFLALWSERYLTPSFKALSYCQMGNILQGCYNDEQ